MTQYVPEIGIHAIVLGDGKQWYVQCGGYACHRKEAIGILQKLEGDEEGLFDFFTSTENDGWAGWCNNGIDAVTADRIEKFVPKFTVDRGRMLECCEAWIVGFVDGKPAILTWDNSD